MRFDLPTRFGHSTRPEMATHADCDVTCLLGLWRQLTHNDGTHVGEVIMTHGLRYLSLVLAV